MASIGFAGEKFGNLGSKQLTVQYLLKEENMILKHHGGIAYVQFAAVFAGELLTDEQFRLLAYLKTFVRRSAWDVVTPSPAAMAKVLRVTEKQVIGIVNDLVNLGIISVPNGVGIRTSTMPFEFRGTSPIVEYMKKKRRPATQTYLLQEYSWGQWGSVRFPKIIARSDYLSNLQLRIYATLCSFGNDENDLAWCRYSSVAERSGNAISIVKTTVAELVDIGLLEVMQKAQRADGTHTVRMAYISKDRFPFLFDDEIAARKTSAAASFNATGRAALTQFASEIVNGTRRTAEKRKEALAQVLAK